MYYSGFMTRQRGTTLFETMLALGLLVLVFGLSFTLLTQYLRQQQRAALIDQTTTTGSALQDVLQNRLVEGTSDLSLPGDGGAFPLARYLDRPVGAAWLAEGGQALCFFERSPGLPTGHGIAGRARGEAIDLVIAGVRTWLGRRPRYLAVLGLPLPDGADIGDMPALRPPYNRARRCGYVARILDLRPATPDDLGGESAAVTDCLVATCAVEPVGDTVPLLSAGAIAAAPLPRDGVRARVVPLLGLTTLTQSAQDGLILTEDAPNSSPLVIAGPGAASEVAFRYIRLDLSETAGSCSLREQLGFSVSGRQRSSSGGLSAPFYVPAVIHDWKPHR